MIGIDEFTALTNVHGSWDVLGRGTVALFGKDRPLHRFRAGAPIDLANYFGQ
jgi:cyanophycinase-like exopeptidase